MRWSARSIVLARLNAQVKRLAAHLERLRLAEYVALFDDPVRLIWINFLAGLARGVGLAVGFTILGALVLFILQRAVMLNLPLIGNVIAEIVRIVQFQLAR